MSSSPTIQTNSFSERIRERMNLREANKINAINERQSFADRMRGFIRFISYVILPLLILWSAITEIAFAGTQFFEMSSSWMATITGTAFLVLFIEGSKFAIGTTAIRFISQGWIIEGWHYVVFFIPVLLWFLIAYGGSSYMSVSAGQPVAKFWRNAVSPIPTINMDSINNVYDARLQSYQVTIEAAQKTTWAGKIVEGAREIISEAQATINGIEEQRAQAIQYAISQNEKRERLQSSESAMFGTWLSRFGGIGEFLQLCCLVLIGIYERISYLEKQEDDDQEEDPTAESDPEPTNRQDPDQEEVATGQRVQIRAFHNPPKQDQQSLLDTMPRAVVQQPETPVAQPKQAVSPASETPVSTKVETIVLVDTTERYLRQCYKQNYRRSKSQKNPATPLANLDKIGKRLRALGYNIKHKESEVRGKIHYDVEFEKEGKYY